MLIQATRFVGYFRFYTKYADEEFLLA